MLKDSIALLDQYPNTRMQAQRRMKNERRNLSLERAQMRTEDEQISERERSWLGSLTDERGGREAAASRRSAMRPHGM